MSGPASRSLSSRIIRAVALTTFVCVALLTATLVVLHHRAVHTQTDALLLRLAEGDAIDSTRDGHGPHIHESSITSPTLSATLTEKYAAIINERCEVIAATRNISATRVSEELCAAERYRGEHWTQFSSELSEDPLRIGAVIALGPSDERLAFIVGIRHRELDAATWQTTRIAVPLALLACLLIIGVAAWVTRFALRDFTSLSEACATIQRRGFDQRLDEALARLQTRSGAPQELQHLSDTLRDALTVVQSMLQERQRFIAEAAHELRTPLTSLRGELELALRRERSPAEYREALSDALRDARTLQGLADHLLESARWERRGAELQPLAGDELSDIIVACAHNASLTPRLRGFDEKEVTVSAEPQLLRRVFANLAENAHLHGNADQLEVTLRLNQGRVVLSVCDNGRGLTETPSTDLFAPFGRTTSSEGHGLGLYLARQLARAMQGDLRYIGTGEQGGACFQLTLKRSQ